MMDKLKERLVGLGEDIHYIEKTTNYGHAEFELCPVFKHGYLRELYIYPRQQENIDAYYRLEIDGFVTSIGFSCYGGNHTEPRFWHNVWCKEHKCLCLRFYVPLGYKSFKVNDHFGDNISLEWGI